MPPTVIPNELVHSIIEDLYDEKNSQSSIRALQNCALVGRDWVRASQRGIFRSIRLELLDGHCVQQLSRLISSFDANPRLATYVKHLVLLDVIQLSNDLDKRMVDVVNRLTELDEISFNHMDWSLLSPVLKQAFLRLLGCSSVTKMNFSFFKTDRFAELTSMLSNLTHLKSLTIGRLRWNDWLTSGSNENPLTIQPLPLPRSIQLIHLDLSATANIQFLDWFQGESSPFEIQNLCTLHVGNDGTVSNYERVALMVRRAAKSLQELGLVGPYGVQQETGAFHLGYAPNLRRIELQGVIQSLSYVPVHWIKSLFEPIVKSNQHDHPLGSLTIHLRLVSDPREHGYEPGDPVQTHAWDQWVIIDRIFENEVFAALEEVSIIIDHFSFTRYAWQGMKDDLRKMLQKVLPFLVNSGKLHVNFFEDTYMNALNTS